MQVREKGEWGEIHTQRQSDSQTVRQSDSQTQRQSDTKTVRQSDTNAHTHTQTQVQTASMAARASSPRPVEAHEKDHQPRVPPPLSALNPDHTRIPPIHALLRASESSRRGRDEGSSPLGAGRPRIESGQQRISPSRPGIPAHCILRNDVGLQCTLSADWQVDGTGGAVRSAFCIRETKAWRSAGPAETARAAVCQSGAIRQVISL